MYLEILRCGVDRWVSIWGDPLLSGALIMALFGVAAGLCGMVAARSDGRERVFWAAASLAAVFLVFNAHLDLHVLPGSIGRCAAKAQGWYDQRRSVQAIYLAVVMLSALAVLGTAAWMFRRQLTANVTVTTGLVVTLGALAAKGAGFHSLDEYHDLTIGPLKLTDLPEVAGAVFIIIGAWSALRPKDAGAMSPATESNFQVIRLFAAVMVMVSHAHSLTGRVGDPISQAIGARFGDIVLALFFTMSGYLLSKRTDEGSPVRAWALSRVSRLLPPVFVATVLSAFVLGPVFTSLDPGAYFADPDTYLYVLRNSTLFHLQRDLPGVFMDNPNPGVVNGSLWMLKYLVICYAILLVGAKLGCTRDWSKFAVFFTIAVTAVFYTRGPLSFFSLPPGAEKFFILFTPFLFGMAMYGFRRIIPLNWALALTLIAICYLIVGTGGFRHALLVAVLYLMFCFGLALPGPWLRLNRLPDISLGVYAFGFPIQQAVVALSGPQTALQNLLIAVPATVIIAILSYYLVEQPAMRWKSRINRASARKT